MVERPRSKFAKSLRQLHGSAGLREPLHCFRIVFSMLQLSEARHCCLVICLPHRLGGLRM